MNISRDRPIIIVPAHMAPYVVFFFPQRYTRTIDAVNMASLGSIYPELNAFLGMDCLDCLWRFPIRSDSMADGNLRANPMAARLPLLALAIHVARSNDFLWAWPGRPHARSSCSSCSSGRSRLITDDHGDHGW